ncbi:unnamed protein product [Microthlaspi erraticum]|uniref:Core Histone H2A/H2B/H3 domain-containing protein n=1 Tax=Microthlaspi erraticum TaxID=1685480 RepID=A0A6D2J5T0_9BRAS|nr:unnamed protein product [Microthlaspi erraticum]
MENNNNNNNDDMTGNHHQQLPIPHSIPPMFDQQVAPAFDPAPAPENQALKNFWMQQMESVEDFKSHQLPLARIKKIMKSDRDVRMISAESPILFSKACEMFIVDLTMRAWQHAEENKRRTLQKPDISAAVARNFAFDFLLDVVPRDDSLTPAADYLPAVPHPDGAATTGTEQQFVYYQPLVDESVEFPTQPWSIPWPEDGDREDVGGHRDDEAVDGVDEDELEAEADQSGGNSGGK